MPNRYALLPMAVLVLLSISACNESPVSSPPPKMAPPGPSPVIGTIQGTIDGTTMTATYTPMAGLNGVSPVIYGNQGTTVTVSGTFISKIDVPGVSRTWSFRVGLRNLEAWPIGSNYTAAAAPDSSGVFLFFSSAPVVTLPVGCACTVLVSNAMGVRTFTGLNQKYFWYNNRPSAVQGSPSTDTTKNNPVWQFKTTSFTAPDTAHAFTFVLLVSAMWPPPHETSWRTVYDGTADSLPDTQGEPRWRRFFVAQDPNLGTEAWTAGTELVLSTSGANVSNYLARNDSLGTMSAVLDAVVRINNGGSGTYQAIWGFREPAGNKQVFVGMNANRVGFVNFNNGTGAWSGAGISCPVATCGVMTNYHTVRLRKFRADSVVVCVDGVRRFVNTHAALQNSDASFNPASVVFGLGHANITSRWQSVAYTIGTDGGACS